ncbi:hypothetical protein [Streptomyces sp. cf386]|uniref:hypothetical protein n=1 Tax=Streptomyces sp. cf386 TaxID=1761904 RepID=UPI00210EAD52|nr:hypothetical protein [Streptomyces sp. cf386]
MVRDPVAVRRLIGYVFGADPGLYEWLSAVDNLRYFAELLSPPLPHWMQTVGEALPRRVLAPRRTAAEPLRTWQQAARARR